MSCEPPQCHVVVADSAAPPLRDGMFQCCVTSPPYFGLRMYGDNALEVGRETTPDEYVASVVRVMAQVHRVLRDDGVLFLNIADSYPSGTAGRASGGGHGVKSAIGDKAKNTQYRAPISRGLRRKDQIGIPWRVAFALQGKSVVSTGDLADLFSAIDSKDFEAASAIKAGMLLHSALAGLFYLRSTIVWAKGRVEPTPDGRFVSSGVCSPESVTDRPTSAWEYLFMFTKSPSYYYDNGLKTDTGGNLRDVVLVSAASVDGRSSGHGALMPMRIAEMCIRLGSRPGDWVYDPFGGSGTTAMAARSLGRNCVVADLNRKYAVDAAKDIASVGPRQATLI